ncbi:hypothetical protein TI39_contig5829g00002 [Zymoseptoria brevis]|uniref:Uncharacterized protein n=1 Tax=Zymoseptoria brevis TaxID=1047168 RepID=A0A0F4G6R9_9PEZI|nr:hypothetical protein TI39_contig5829g00002 [Zymoseptoria brevis]
MQYLTNTLLLASLAISNVAAAPAADSKAIKARQDFSVDSGAPNSSGGNGGNGPNVAGSDYIYTQANPNRKERRSQNGAEDDAEHLEERSKSPFDPDFGHDKREAYIYTQKKERRDNSNLQARNAYIYTQKDRREAADVEARNAYIYTQKDRRDPVEARDAYIYTQKERRDPVEARDAYIYTQKDRRDPIEARDAYIYTQKERRDPVEARDAYIYTQKERRDPVEARNPKVDNDGSHVTPGHRDEEMMDVGSA